MYPVVSIQNGQTQVDNLRMNSRPIISKSPIQTFHFEESIWTDCVAIKGVFKSLPLILFATESLPVDRNSTQIEDVGINGLASVGHLPHSIRCQPEQLLDKISFPERDNIPELEPRNTLTLKEVEALEKLSAFLETDMKSIDEVSHTLPDELQAVMEITKKQKDSWKDDSKGLIESETCFPSRSYL